MTLLNRAAAAKRSFSMSFWAATGLSALALLATPAACATEAARTPRQEAEAVRIVMATRHGPITIDLYPEQAPLTTVNFLRYVDGGSLDGSTFYRAVRLDNQRPSEVPIQVVQGGLFAKPQEEGEVPRATFPPIPHETTADTRVTHGPGTISMARAAPGTATSEFFISIGENPELDAGGRRNPDGLGFAAFGQVVAGMDVVHLIHRASTAASRDMDLGVMQGQLLDELIEICRVFRVAAKGTPGTRIARSTAEDSCRAR